MTVIVSIKINDGIVMAADSVSSYPSGMTYSHANKVVNIWTGRPVGAMVTGRGGIGSESIETLLKDLRKRFDGNDPAFPDWKLDPLTTTMHEIAHRTHHFLLKEKAEIDPENTSLLVRICGYSPNRPLSEAWDVRIEKFNCPLPVQSQTENDWGVRWEGDYDALDRLILGRGVDMVSASMQEFGMNLDDAISANYRLTNRLTKCLALPSMPIQDAVDLARFLVETTINFVKFSVDRPSKTVGGPIEIAAITKHEGFRWVQRKHSFPAGLNLEPPV